MVIVDTIPGLGCSRRRLASRYDRYQRQHHPWTARDTLRINSTELSNKLSTVTIRQDFTDKMINTLEDGAANLTNADLNEEGANLLMLQTRQSLGTTSLSMASQAAQSVLRLF
jgi:flagellin